MKLLSPIDVTVLTWLKPELDSTLHQARHALERFVEEGQGITALRECNEQLHQVAGILNMVELTGAARLAEEMEQLAQTLSEGSLSGVDSAFSLLMQCIVQLPDYLERLQNGHRDVPVVLLPLINELRSIRQADPITEEAVYSAPTLQPLPADVLAQIKSTGTDRSFAELAAQFQNQLLAWLNNQSDAQLSAQLSHSCAQMCAHSLQESSRKLFWVASGLLEALARGAMAPSQAFKQTLIKIDQEVNYLNNHSMGEIRQVSPVRLTQELLYFVAQQPQASERLQQIYSVFQLEQNIPDEDEIKHAKSSLLGRNNALIDSVSAVIKEDILRVKDALDMSIRQADITPASMGSLIGVLGRIEGTLGLIDANEAKKHVERDRESIQAYINGQASLSDTDLMRIAQSLLSVESMLDHQALNTVGRKQAKMASDFMASSQSRQLLDALIRESIVNFAQVRQAYVAFVENYWEHQQLAPVPALLKEVSGALAILEHTSVSAFIDAINAYTRVEFIDRQNIPNGEQMERIAEVMASLEYYLESVRDRRPNRERILDITQRSLESLNYWPVPEYAALAAAIELPVLPKVPVPVSVPEYGEQPASAHATPESMVSTPAEIIHVDVAGDLVGGFDYQAEGIDDEIREIFLEEFAEELGNLPELLQQWRDEPENIELVRPIRRVFHTLKGSGRLVGAKSLSDFSWKIESLLNRVLDESRPPSAAVMAMVQTSIGALPVFNKALLGETVTLDMQGLANTAERLADGDEVFYAQAPAVPHLSNDSEAADAIFVVEQSVFVAEPMQEPIIDPVLLEILKPEVGAHLETVNAWLAQGAENGQADYHDSIFRAIHTMNGAFAMTEVTSLANVLAPAESLVRRGIAHHIPANAETLACLAQVADAVQATLDDLSANTMPSQYPELASWIVAKRDELPEIASSVPTPMALADMEDERLEAERIEAERVEAERVEAERVEAERVEAERVEAERIEAERIEAERVEAERVEAERVEAERVASELAAAELAEFERLEAERVASELAAVELAEFERLEYERLEYERVEAERVEAERVEAERVEAERKQQADTEYGMSLEELERLTDPNYKPETPVLSAFDAEALSDSEAAADSTATAVVAEALNRIESQTSAAVDSDPQDGEMERLDMSELDEELLDIFAEEAKDLLDQSDNLLVQLKAAPEDFEPLFGLQRHLHTIKGGARMAGLFGIGELSHSLESFIQINTDQSLPPNPHQIGIIEKSLDALHRMAHQVEERHAPESPAEIIHLLETGHATAEEITESTNEVSSSPAPEHVAAPALAVKVFKPLSGPIELAELETDEAMRTPQEVVRIRADLLDQLVNFAGEVAIYRARLEQQLGQFKTNLVELDQTTSRLREQLRRLDIETEAQIAARNIRETDQGNKDFDPLELDRFTTQQQLSRSLAESSNDLINLQATMDDLTRHHETLLLQQSRVSSELQEGLMRTRMLPFETLLPRLRRVLRQASQDAGRQVELRVDGAHGEMDRTVLDRMIAPLEHLLRNAVAHGIESTEERKRLGKPEVGTVVINIAHEGTEVVLSVRDDGRGLDAEQIKRKGIERGLITADAELTEQQILTLITQTGFTTADTITRLAGRGIGMDVVSSEIKALNGNLGILSNLGRGTEFIVRLPLNLAVTKAVFVKIGERQFAIPIASVDGVGRIGRSELDEKLKLEVPEFSYAGNPHKIYDLGNLLDLPTATATGSMQMPMLLSRSGQDRIAICVDQVLGSQEIVVKPVGPQVTSVPGVYGASIMPDGGVIVILDLAPLVRHNAGRYVPQTAEPVDSGKRSMPLVMVVDDSITMRKVTSRILERNNFEVITARDGVEAIEKMAEQVPDLVLLDIEMPRMDGYEVAQNMKADSRLHKVPIMMITSRTGDKHRQRAFDLGVERYLGKPYQEFELMRQVNEVFKK